MLRRTLHLCGLVIFAMTVSSCLFDPEEKQDPPPPVDTGSFLPLTTEEAVLNNLQRCYNQRTQLPYYDELLDEAFVFYLDSGDVQNGAPESWDKQTELLYSGRLLDKNYTGDHKCNSLTLDIDFEDGVSWQDVIPESAPDEIWRVAIVTYSFDVHLEGNDNFIAVPGSKAQFTVRPIMVDGGKQWRLVEWRDLAGQG